MIEMSRWVLTALEIGHLKCFFLIVFLMYWKIKVIVNSTEWEMTLDFHGFDQPWMRYALGEDFYQTNQIIGI